MKTLVQRVSPAAVEISDGTSSIYVANEDLLAISSDLRRLAEDFATAQREDAEFPATLEEAIAERTQL